MTEDTQDKKRITIIAVCSVLFVAVVVVATIGITMKQDNSGDHEKENKNKIAQIFTYNKKAVEIICQPTQFKETCEEEVEKEAGDKTDMKDLVQAAFKATIKYVNQAAENAILLKYVEKDKGTKSSLDACKVLLDSSARELKKSVDIVKKMDVNNVSKLLTDLKIWLSDSISNQVGCLDGFKNTESETRAGERMKELLNVTMQLNINALTIADRFHNLELDVAFRRRRRRLLQDEDDLPVVGHSDWTSFQERNKGWNRRRLFQAEYDDGRYDWINSFLERNKEWDRSRLLEAGEELIYKVQEDYGVPVEGPEAKGLPIEGHSDSDETSSSKKNNKWNHRGLREAKKSEVEGHSEITSFLERKKEWHKLLEIGEEFMNKVQEYDGVPVESRDEFKFPVEGHSDYTSYPDKVEEEYGVPVEGPDGQILPVEGPNESRLPVEGHSDYNSYPDKVEEEYGVPVEGPDGQILPVEGPNESRLPVEGHSDSTSFSERNKDWNRR